jgi:hypothetical protein
MNEPAPIQDITGLSIKQINQLKYESITLTEEETKAAILEGKIKKHNREKFKPYWALQEEDYGIE